jgi:hypothetical protein
MVSFGGSYELGTALFISLIIIIWIGWLIRQFGVWLWECVGSQRPLSGHERLAVLASMVCLAVGLHLGAAELERLSGADQFKGPLGDSPAARDCDHLATTNKNVDFLKCWNDRAHRVRELKDQHWYMPASAAVSLLAVMWTAIMAATWVWRGFAERKGS